MAAAPASTPTHSPPTSSPTRAGTNPFATSSSATGIPSDLPYVRQTFEAPMLPLPCALMSSPRTRRTTTTPNGIDPIRYPPTITSASGITARGYTFGMPYASTQPLTTSQSRFSKNASM